MVGMPDKTYRILIVDDNRDVLEGLSDILIDLGYETDTATSGEDALGKVEQFCPNESQCHYDLCLLDFKMPGIDGVELYKRILKFNPRMRAIMVTAYAGDDGVKRAIEAGTWQVLKKPVHIRQLIEIIAEAID